MMMSRLWKITSSIAIALLLSIKFQETNAIRVCGSNLADTLALACSDRGGFHTPVRRSAKGHIMLKRDIVYLMKPKSRSQPKNLVTGLSKEVPDALERRSSQGSSWFNLPGVVDECCRRSCTYETLVSYCATTGASTTPPSAFTDFFNNVGYHSSEDGIKGKSSDESVTSEEAQSDQPNNANVGLQDERSQLETQVGNPRLKGGLSTGRYGQVQQLGRRPNIGMYSRNRPFFFVVSSRFNGHNDYPNFA